MKVKKEKEKIPVLGYMGKVEQIEAQKIECPGFEFYLYKSSKYYQVYEKNTGRTFVSPLKTRKEALEKFKELFNKFGEKINELVIKSIEKDGYIKDREIGSWIR